MKVLGLVQSVAFVGLAGCAGHGFDSGEVQQAVLTTFSGNDPGVGPGQARPNSTAARAAFVAALGSADVTSIDFETSPAGPFVALSPVPGVTISLSASDGGGVGTSGIATSNPSALIEGYNTTIPGARYVKIEPAFGTGIVTVTFDYATAIRGFGAFFTGVGTVDNTEVEMLFDNGTQQVFAIPGASTGGVSFFGFTDPGKGITRVQIRERLLSTGARDIFSIDDVITARDNLPPVAVCSDATITADNTCTGVASVDGGSSDPDGDAITCVQSPADPYALGTTAVTLTCTDSYGASASCDATVTVVDATAPDLQCPADQTVECNDGNGGATATFAATATDACDGAPDVACAPGSGSTFALGASQVACSATDDAGNSASCQHTVTVVDTTPPVVTGGGDAGLLWPPNHTLHRIDLAQCIGAITDACHGPLGVAGSAQITCCTSDESADDCAIVDNDSVDVRAERDGNGNGRVYTIRYDVTDASGNVTSQSCTVGVPHSQNGVAPIDDGALTCGP